MNLYFRISFSLLLLVAVGCVSPAENLEVPPVTQRDGQTTRSASLQTSQPIVFTDSEELRFDTGPVDDDAPTEFTVTDSGLRYRILRSSDGPKPGPTDSVKVHYRGWLDNGKEFDSSYDRGTPTSFRLNEVVPGWGEGLQLIGTGGMIELWVPARLGYGTAGMGGTIPPNATLHFVVELLEVN
ncbi:MAG: FKBP-type peptidyl-prolyl cis-trans isomerase [Fuerstiella sp.]